VATPPPDDGPVGAGGPAPELIEGGFALETAQAPILHDGLNLADLAHVLDLRARGLIPDDAGRELLSVLLEIDAIPASDFPYDPQFGESYNSRERVLAGKLGTGAGWLHAGRPRREATRVAFRLYLRRELAGLIGDVGGLATALSEQAGRHVETLFPDQTYLQQAQPSTVGHYLTAFAYPVIRDGERLVEALGWVNRSPGGAGCVNGSRLIDERDRLAELLGFDEVITHTRDAMWQTDGLVQLLATVASLATTQDELAEDLEIWASREFDYVDLDDAFTRASVLMPQKRNPYALAMIRGSTGSLIGQLAGFLALQKGPSARGDKLIFAYGEVPRAVDLVRRLTRLSRGVVATLRFNERRLREQLDGGFSQATDLAEYVMTACELDYRTAYRLVGTAVRRAAASGRRGADIDPALLDEVAEELVGRRLRLDPTALAAAMGWEAIVATRTAVGGAAHEPVAAMVAETAARARRLVDVSVTRRAGYAAAEAALRDQARAVAEAAP
jgi:argininosuccinate lyase